MPASAIGRKKIDVMNGVCRVHVQNVTQQIVNQLRSGTVFGWDDVFKFIISFFVIFPIVTIIHLAGHIFFVTISGGSEKKIILGFGKKLFSFWNIEVRQFYFMNGGCEFVKLRWDTKLSNSLIFLGGSCFNILSILLVNGLIKLDYMEPATFWYQFIYFSFYVVFFSLFPVHYADGRPSDGKAFLLGLKRIPSDKLTDDLSLKNKEND